MIVNTPGSVKGATLHRSALGKDELLSTNIDFDTAQSLFDTGKVPFYVTGPWAVDKAKDAGIKYAISPLPTHRGREMQPFLGVQMFYVSAKAKNDAFAQEFVTNYVTRKDVQLDLFELGTGRRPSRPPTRRSLPTDPDVKAWYEAGVGALPMPNIPAMNSVWGPLGQATADVMAQKEAGQARMAAAQKEIVANIQKNG